MSEIRHALRSLLQKPAFALTAVLTIGLGIGANTAVYAVVHAVLLEPLPFRQPHELVQIWETHPELHNLQVSVPDYLDWKHSARSVNLAAYTFQAMDKGTLSGQGAPTAIQGTNASSELFAVLAIEPLLGRLYTPREETEKQPVAVISEALWRRKFSSDPHIIGRALRFDTSSFTIIGVLHRETAFPVWADVWMPFSQIEPELSSTRKFHPLEVIGRLRTGFSLQQAEMEMQKTAAQLSQAHPATNGKIGAYVVPLMEMITGEEKPALMTAWIAVGLVLLIACANLAHLMMARALSRRHEIAITLALGASTWTLTRTFVIETLLLAFTGGLLGVGFANLTLPVMRHLSQEQLPRFNSVELNIPVLFYGLLAAFVMALLFAAPAYLQVLRADVNDTISSGGTRSFSGRQTWLSSALMSSEIALALVVLLSATMLVRSFLIALQTEPGFQPGRVLAVHSPLVDRDWSKSYQLLRDRILPGLEAIPGVQQVAAVNSVPMSLGKTEHSRFATRFGIAGKDFAPGRFPTAQIRWCTANYFRLLGIPLMAGRFLEHTDYSHPRYLINQALARRFFPHSDPVGQKLLLGVVTPHPESAEIVGVVGDVLEFGLTSSPEPAMYSLDVSPEMDLVIKTASTNPSIANAVAAGIQRLDPHGAIGPVRTLDDYVSASLARQRFILVLIATFAGLASCLCAVGIYGVFSYSVARRMREFGIRSAVGARAKDLLAQILKECVLVVVPGLLAGIAVSIGYSQFLQALLFRVSPTDAFSTGLAIVTVLTFCLGSIAIPALRAARVHPADVLRQQ